VLGAVLVGCAHAVDRLGGVAAAVAARHRAQAGADLLAAALALPGGAAAACDRAAALSDAMGLQLADCTVDRPTSSSRSPSRFRWAVGLGTARAPCRAIWSGPATHSDADILVNRAWRRQIRTPDHLDNECAAGSRH
jgi:hypothetical protein